ncbi:MAG: fatty acid desaturase family protein [Deltaproteobacteria bacterium]
MSRQTERPGSSAASAATDLEPWRAFGAIAADWSLISACLACAACFPVWPVYVVAAVVIARTQLALAVLMHEAAHGLLSRRRSVNDIIGQAFAAGPLFLSLWIYRSGHLKHHRRPMASDDPVAAIFGIGDYPIPRRKLLVRLLGDLTGVGYFISLAKLLRGDYRDVLRVPPGDAGRNGSVVLSILVTNGLLLAVLTASGHPWLYFELWLLPALTLLQVAGRIRAIMEHAGHSFADDQRKNARTITRPSFQTFFFGPHAVHFHIEHHENVRVPFYRLKQLHRTMSDAGLLPSENLYRGYGRILKEVTTTSGHAA